jgi:RNA polymerase-binding protein DksA
MVPAKKGSAKKSAAKKSALGKGAGGRAAAASAGKGSAAKKAAVRRSAAAGGGAKKAAVKKTAKATAKKTVKKTTVKKTTVRQTPGRKAAGAKKAGTKTAAAAKVATPRKRPPRAAKLDAAALAQIRARLQDELADLERRRAELEESSFDAAQSDVAGEGGLDEDFADAGTATFERERDLSIRNNILDLIEQIERAVARIDDGTYGTCERCGRLIDASRLKALPHASLCMDCKRRDERAR